MPTTAHTKDDVIQIRASRETKALFNRAAALRAHKPREPARAFRIGRNGKGVHGYIREAEAMLKGMS